MPGYSRLQDLRHEIYGTSLPQRHNRAKILAALIVHRWRNEASKRLNTTLGAYLASIGIEEVSENKVVVALPEGASGTHARLARMVEFGYGGGGIGTFGNVYDMRTRGQNLLSTIPKSNTAYGPQTVVPFNFSKKQASSRVSSGDIMKAFQAQAGDGKPVMTFRKENGKTSWGTRLGGSLSTKLKSHHASTRAQSMYHRGVSAGRSGKMVSGGFFMLRTVSDPRKPGSPSWVSKGIKPRDIARRYVVPALPELLESAGII